jgi:hypothetical protein
VGCRTVAIGPGVAILCDRTRRESCSTPGCRGTSEALCDFSLTGSKAGKTCDKRLCRSCRVRQPGEDHDYCRAHAAQGG